MQALLTAFASLAILGSTAASAAADAPYVDGQASLGVGLGDPTALDLKLWTTRDSGFDLGIGLERFDTHLGIYGEYELGLAAFRLGDAGGRGVFYVGVGGAVGFYDAGTSVALVIPVGLDLRFPAPFDLFFEARPGVGLVRYPAFGLGGQIGIRLRL